MISLLLLTYSIMILHAVNHFGILVSRISFSSFLTFVWLRHCMTKERADRKTVGIPCFVGFKNYYYYYYYRMEKSRRSLSLNAAAELCSSFYELYTYENFKGHGLQSVITHETPRVGNCVFLARLLWLICSQS